MCYTVEGKEIINGEYYLLLENTREFDRSSNYSSNNGLYTGLNATVNAQSVIYPLT